MDLKRVATFFLIIGLVSCLCLITSCKRSGGGNGLSSLALLGLSGSDTPPDSLDVPTGVTASNNRTADVTVAWNSVSGARYYNVFRSDSESGPFALQGDINVNAYHDDNAVPGQKYYYTVEAGWRSMKDPAVVVLSGQSAPDEGYVLLLAPAAVTASTDSASQVIVAWSPVDHVGTYRVQRSLSQTTGFSDIATGLTDVEYQDSLADAGTRYYYRVVAYSASDISGNASSAVQGYRCTSSPGNFTASDDVYYSYVKLTWDAAASSNGYEIYRNSNLLTTTMVLYFNDTMAVPGTTYQYKVVSVHVNGGKSLPAQDTGSRRSSSVTIPCTVSWTANREKAVNSAGGGYRVYYRTSHIPDAGYTDITHVDVPYVSGSSAPNSTTLNLGPGAGTWYIRIAGYSGLNGDSSSQLSTESSVTVY